MCRVFWKIQEICNKMGSRIFKIDGEMSEIMESKVDNPKNLVSRNWALLCLPWNFTFFRMRFINFFLACMVQKYQNERAPIFYYGNSPKNSKKDQKIAGLQLLDWIQPYWMTWYFAVITSGRHFASASDLLALTVALARILALKR